MYEQANKTISQGLSPGARMALGFVSGLFGVVMLLIAPPTDAAIYFYSFGALCLVITIACITTGRLRQFVGSVVGCALFGLSLVYLVAEVTGGVDWSGRRSEPSVFNALLFFFFIGLPGVTYAYKARFGFRRQP